MSRYKIFRITIDDNVVTVFHSGPFGKTYLELETIPPEVLASPFSNSIVLRERKVLGGIIYEFVGFRK